MGERFSGFVGLVVLGFVGLYLVRYLFDTYVPTNYVSQHTSVDNHTTVTITNNMPPDYSGIALIILAIAVLLYVVFTAVLPAVRKRRGKYE